MKSKKSLLSFGILALVLVLGVGYALVSSVGLTISGSASVADAALKVAFNGVTDTSSDKITATSQDGTLEATIDVNGIQLGETVTATYTIKNEETDVNASVIKESIENNKPDFFEVTTDVDETAKTISASSTETVTVSVKLIQTPVTSADSTATIKVNLAANPVE